MRSMTGFGRASFSSDNFSIAVELKSVNNRFLDIGMRLPAELQSLESTIKKKISDRLARGRVDVSLQYERNDEVGYELNRPLITGFLSAMKTMRDEFGLQGEPDINVIARLPNAVTAAKEEPSGEFLAAIEPVFSTALDDLVSMREKEGEALLTELSSRLSAIEANLAPIEEESASIVDEHRIRLNKRIADILAKTDSEIEVDQAKLAQEVAYLADRSDISEEITRLRSHIDQFRRIMNETDDIGKRLDFLTQELNREANTIASKSSNIKVKELSLEVKSEIEKIREQIQNVE